MALGFLDRSRIVAPPGWTRWLVPPAALSVHLSIGQEAVAAGACAARRDDDVIASNHRGHGHCLAKGGRPDRMMAELFGSRDGYCAGVGGSMHIADLERGILGANGIVGAGILIATGAGLSFQVEGSGRGSTSAQRTPPRSGVTSPRTPLCRPLTTATSLPSGSLPTSSTLAIVPTVA